MPVSLPHEGHHSLHPELPALQTYYACLFELQPAQRESLPVSASSPLPPSPRTTVHKETVQSPVVYPYAAQVVAADRGGLPVVDQVYLHHEEVISSLSSRVISVFVSLNNFRISLVALTSPRPTSIVK
mmetsp:Transcript_25192/g.41526  ORF Transcript_25192/g.41526 Transcript_25192/m.41526 type:complete len:128 (-) Transcript_25192:796-1179(-)